MGKKSTKENKTKYHLVREELGWSREYASEQMGMITPERLERIENEKVTPDPKDCWGCASCIKECAFGAIAFYLGAGNGRGRPQVASAWQGRFRCDVSSV